MTFTQKILCPVINFLVERFFPNGMFVGSYYWFEVSGNVEASEKWGTPQMASAMLVVSKVRETGATKAVFEAGDMSLDGEAIGDWRLTVEKIG